MYVCTYVCVYVWMQMKAGDGMALGFSLFLAIIMAIVVAPCRFTPLFVLVLVCVFAFAFAFVFVHELLWGMRFHFVSFHFVSSRLVWFCLPESSEQTTSTTPTFGHQNIYLPMGGLLCAVCVCVCVWAWQRHSSPQHPTLPSPRNTRVWMEKRGCGKTARCANLWPVRNFPTQHRRRRLEATLSAWPQKVGNTFCTLSMEQEGGRVGELGLATDPPPPQGVLI